MKYCILLFHFLMVINSVLIFSQESNADFFIKRETELVSFYNGLIDNTVSNSEREKKQEQFKNLLISTLNAEGSWLFPFDSLKHIGRVVSPNGKLIVYTWNFPRDFGYSDYYGIVQYVSKKGKNVRTYQLSQIKETVEDPFLYICDTNKWIGALYYEIVETKFRGTECYTLLGYNFNNVLSNKKVIDAIAIDKEMNIRFEPNMFFYENKVCNRIEFEYAENVQMTLVYNEELQKIIFDHLSPFRPSLEGQYQFYGPDASNDAFYFDEGIWKHEEKISVSN